MAHKSPETALNQACDSDGGVAAAGSVMNARADAGDDVCDLITMDVEIARLSGALDDSESQIASLNKMLDLMRRTARQRSDGSDRGELLVKRA